jgi:tetratricopeptide (TPR) repeat protein
MEERGRDVAALETLAEALDSAQGLAYRSRRAEAALRRSLYERRTGDSAAATAALQAAVRLARKAQDLGNEADARMAWGWLRLAQGGAETARQQFEQALVLARECGARRVEAESLAGIGWVLWSTGEPHVTSISTYFEQAREIYRDTGDRRGEARALFRRGILCVGQGDLAQARAYYERALGVNREIGDRRGEASPLGALECVYKGEDDYAGARVCQEQALAIQREVGEVPGVAMERASLGATLAEQGCYAQGEALCRRALRSLRESGDRRSEGHVLSTLGLIHYHQGNYAQARTFLEESRSLCRDFGERWVESKATAALGLLSHAQGDDVKARDYARLALEIGPAPYHLGQGQAALVLGHALAGLGDGARAIEAYRRALDRLRQSGHVTPPVEAQAGLARVALALGDKPQALEHSETILQHLQAHTLDGTSEPFRIWLSCYQVLKAHEDARAEEVLRSAYRLLQERAAGIENEHLRRSFLEKVPPHRELIQEGERIGLSG